jgi:pyridinium-3,5-biscarboxylic acid mononucleotide synthase
MSDNTPRRSRSDDLLIEIREAIDSDKGPIPDRDAQIDFQRRARIGTPEIIYAENKTAEQLLRIADTMLERAGSVLLSRVPNHMMEELHRSFSSYNIEQPPGASMLRISSTSPNNPNTLVGKIAIFTAGTSDVPRAEEVRLVASEMGSEAQIWADIGVAGLHRLFRPFRQAIDWGASVFVVVAGMDGALPSVVAGLSPVPVIGLPVSVGYGYGANGEGALMSMLQTCAPGLTVVNIDNSVGAGIAAARIALQSTPGE